MRPDCAYSVELPRGLLLTPVWASQAAWRVFSWLLLSAARDGAQESVYGHAPRFSASHLEIGRATGLSRKSVQTALRLLEAEKVIVREGAHAGRAVVYAVGAYPQNEQFVYAMGAGNGAISGAPARAGSEQRSGQVLDTDNSRYSNRMDIEGCRSGSTPRAGNGAANGVGTGAETGASIPDVMPKRLEPPQPDVQPGKPVRWRWTCGICGTDSVGMVPAGVVPPPVPCLKSKWGRCDGMAYPERER